MSEVMNESARAAERYAAELLDKIGFPITRDQAVAIIAIAYLEGGQAMLAWARENIMA